MAWRVKMPASFGQCLPNAFSGAAPCKAGLQSFAHFKVLKQLLKSSRLLKWGQSGWCNFTFHKSPALGLLDHEARIPLGPEDAALPGCGAHWQEGTPAAKYCPFVWCEGLLASGGAHTSLSDDSCKGISIRCWDYHCCCQHTLLEKCLPHCNHNWCKLNVSGWVGTPTPSPELLSLHLTRYKQKAHSHVSGEYQTFHQKAETILLQSAACQDLTVLWNINDLWDSNPCLSHR